MDERTLTALKGSIAKWEGILAGTVEDEGIDNCPLCQQFYIYSWCDGCPVSSTTKKHSCIGTPYDAWTRYIENRDYRDEAAGISKSNFDGKDMVALGLAKCELDFLRSLLPESEK